jgi:hypothetical protein
MSSAKKNRPSSSMSYARQNNTVPIIIGLVIFIVIVGSTITTVIFSNKVLNKTNDLCANSCRLQNVLTPANIPACISAQCAN